jgi:hypothetical protein
MGADKLLIGAPADRQPPRPGSERPRDPLEGDDEVDPETARWRRVLESVCAGCGLRDTRDAKTGMCVKCGYVKRGAAQETAPPGAVSERRHPQPTHNGSKCTTLREIAARSVTYDESLTIARAESLRILAMSAFYRLRGGFRLRLPPWGRCNPAAGGAPPSCPSRGGAARTPIRRVEGQPRWARRAHCRRHGSLHGERRPRPCPWQVGTSSGAPASPRQPPRPHRHAATSKGT